MLPDEHRYLIQDLSFSFIPIFEYIIYLWLLYRQALQQLYASLAAETNHSILKIKNMYE